MARDHLTLNFQIKVQSSDPVIDGLEQHIKTVLPPQILVREKCQNHLRFIYGQMGQFWSQRAKQPRNRQSFPRFKHNFLDFPLNRPRKQRKTKQKVNDNKILFNTTNIIIQQFQHDYNQ